MVLYKKELLNILGLSQIELELDRELGWDKLSDFPIAPIKSVFIVIDGNSKEIDYDKVNKQNIQGILENCQQAYANSILIDNIENEYTFGDITVKTNKEKTKIENIDKPSLYEIFVIEYKNAYKFPRGLNTAFVIGDGTIIENGEVIRKGRHINVQQNIREEDNNEKRVFKKPIW